MVQYLLKAHKTCELTLLQDLSTRPQYQHFKARRGLARNHPVAVLGTVGGVGILVYATSQQEIPYTGRSHAILVSAESEKTMGEETFKEILREAQMEGKLVPAHHPAMALVRRVGTRIARAVSDSYGGGFQEHMKGLEWEFAVINSPEVNAFVVPGGKVVIYAGLLDVIDSEDELAAVLAHESAHVLARHAAERLMQAGTLEIVRMVAYWGFGLPIPGAPLQAVFFLPNSRKAETEADLIGVQVMARACFDPRASMTMFEKLGKAEQKAGGYVPKMLRTHPLSTDRIKAISAIIPKAETLYENSNCDVLKGPLKGFQRAFGSSWT
ncbi:M48 peptidase [Helicosporidium sp. ATCC 50920]|nr:M48 peptidase [Helicosporidium sp. ATCC 50920]|eukprot:KDD75482.1 M48 peptidase [Helicosporidium sp. ATCC 50920]